MISRRTFLKGFLALSAAGAGLGGYAIAEPFRLRIARHRVSPSGWPKGLNVRLAVIADLHVIEPFLGLDRLAQIVARTNALAPDAILLPGDFVPSAGMKRWARRIGGHEVPYTEWASVLAGLEAPCGVHAALGNHDWWESDEVQITKTGPPPLLPALEAAGIRVHENSSVRCEKNGRAFWISGLGDQWAYYIVEDRRRGNYEGVDDLPALLSAVPEGEPLIMMAHEPDIFAEMGDLGRRVSLTVSGHTHGGQVQILGYRPVVPSRYGRRYAYGHIEEEGRHLVVSAGLGCSGMPVRFGVPPEIVLIELTGDAA